MFLIRISGINMLFEGYSLKIFITIFFFFAKIAFYLKFFKKFWLQPTSFLKYIWAISIIFNICWNWVQMLIICPVFRIAQNGKKGMVGHSRKLGNSKFQTISSLSLKVMGTQISKNSKKGLKFTRVFSYFITFLLLVLNFRCPLI